MKKTFITVIWCIILVLSSSTISGASSRTTFITIGTGSITGVYYPTGGAIAKIVNSKRRVYGIRCTVHSTSGSVYNINAVKAGELEFGIVQSDRQYQAWNGKAEWREKGAIGDLRSVFSIYAEAVTIVAAADANIQSMNDLRGRRVNVGSPGSGQRQNAIDALQMAGIDYQKAFLGEWYRSSQMAEALQDGRIDAFFFTTGHPNGLIKEATSGRRKVRFIPIDNIERLLNRYPYYTNAIVPVKYYPGALNKRDVQTFGVKATLVTSERVPDFIVYAVTKEVFNNLEKFKRLHPAFAFLTKQGMLKGLSAPIHPGALKFYKEAGLR